MNVSRDSEGSCFTNYIYVLLNKLSYHEQIVFQSKRYQLLCLYFVAKIHFETIQTDFLKSESKTIFKFPLAKKYVLCLIEIYNRI